ncbi:MAG: phage holin family protein [bacterium]|nr:phage holin family protein [bacterium]
MNGILVRLAITAVGLWIATSLVDGIRADDTFTLVLAAMVLGLVNAVVRPVAILLTIPLTVLTLGLFLWPINAGMLWLVGRLLDGFDVASFGAALVGAALVSVTGWIGNAYIGDGGRYEVVMIRRRETDRRELP